MALFDENIDNNFFFNRDDIFLNEFLNLVLAADAEVAVTK